MIDLHAKTSTFIAGLIVAGTVAVIGLLGVSNTGCNLTDIIGTNSTPIVTNTPATNSPGPVTNTPVPVTVGWHGCMFVPGTSGLPNNHGVSSQLEYRGVHNKANENIIRIDMLQCVKNWGGNVLCYIRGEFSRPNEVLDMALNGMKHPSDGHYFPTKAPDTNNGEVDWAMWAKQTYGISHHICWIWNDNTSVPFTQAIVNEAVKSYDGTRLGMENVAFGVCLEANEIMSVDLVTSACGWIHTASPTSPVIVGSANEAFLQQVGSKVPYVIVWLEQISNPVTAPLTRATFPAYLASLNNLAAKLGKDRVIPGEWYAASAADVAWMTQQLQATGFTVLGSGKYN